MRRVTRMLSSRLVVACVCLACACSLPAAPEAWVCKLPDGSIDVEARVDGWHLLVNIPRGSDPSFSLGYPGGGGIRGVIRDMDEAAPPPVPAPGVTLSPGECARLLYAIDVGCGLLSYERATMAPLLARLRAAPAPGPGVADMQALTVPMGTLSAEDAEWLRDVLMPVVGCYQHEHERQSMLTRLRAIIDRAAIPAPGVTPTQRVLDEVAAERVRQDATWGEQNHPSLDRVLLERPGGCTPERMAEEYEIPTEERARFLLAAAVTRGSPSWAGILVEEISESVKAGVRSDAACRAELVQVAAVAVAWIECIDRRAAVPAPGRAEEA